MRFFKTLLFFIFLSTSVMLTAQNEQKEKPKLHVGGALRFNYNLSSWKEGQKKRGGDFGYDLFRINAKASYKGVKLNVEYRFYSKAFGGGMLKQGWIGYDFNSLDNIQLGLTQVPFGITPYDSHNWFFNINYYIGLEDDHDMGLKFTHSGKKWKYALAFFKNAEELRFGSTSDVSNSRYSYDVGSLTNGTYRNKEVNQFNGKVVRKFKTGSVKHEIGVSALYGGVFNLDTQKMGWHYAFAGHYQMYAGNFNLKLQVSKYKYDTKNPAGQNNDVLAMTAYGYPYLVAAEATSYTLGVSYSVPVHLGPISNLKFYNDFGYLDKTKDSFYDSYMNVTGFMITAGQVYTYVDMAQGKNQPWLGPVWTDALGTGTQGAQWARRFNINIGYYF